MLNGDDVDDNDEEDKVTLGILELITDFNNKRAVWGK